MTRQFPFLTNLSRILALLACLALGAWAQSVVTGDLTGSITDPSGAVVPNAQVTLKNLATGESKNATTNASGDFRFSLLRPGSYSVSANAPGFQADTRNADVSLGQVTRVNIQAKMAGSSQIVEVTTEAPLLQTDNANISTTFNAAQIDNLPAPGGDTTSYAFTAPGVTASSGGGYGNFSAYGLPSNSNLFTVNGNDNMDPYLNLNNSGASNLTLGANEVSEVAVVENGYSVQYGRNAGAQVNSVTKSGANSLHGNATWWYNDKIFNANDYFSNHTATPRGHAVNNQYAASVGGPIIKNKLFFFADQEQLRYVLPGSTPVFLPSPQFEAYALAILPVAQVPFYQRQFNLYNGANGANRATPVAGATSCGDLVGAAGGVTTPFASGAIPCAVNFQSTTNNLNTEWLLSTRVDYNISHTDTLFGRFRTDHGIQATGTDPINPVFNAFSVQPEYEGQLNETHIFSNSATNQFIASGLWYQALFNANNLSAALQAFPAAALFNDGVFSGLGGNANAGLGLNSYPQGRNVTQWQLIDDFSKLKGSHDLKFGANFRRNDVSSYATGTGTTGLLTINSLTDYVTGSLGNGSTFGQSFRTINQVPIALYSLALYGQDQWKASSKLSITFGLRVDRNANPKCQKNCFTRLNAPFLSESAAANVNTPYNASIQTGRSNAFQSVESATFQPRVGVTYSANSTTVLRFGVGLFSDLFPGTIADRFITNGPNVTNFTTTAGTIDAPGTQGSIFNSVAAANSAFQAGFPSGGTLGSIAATTNQLFGGLNYNTAAKKILNPKFLEYNFELEQAIGRRATLSFGYVGNYGFDEFNQNLLENAICKPNTAGTNCPFAGITTIARDPRFKEIRDLNNDGYSNYNGFTSAVRFRMANYLQGGFSYTWSKAMDTCSNNCLLPFNDLTAVSIRNQLSPTGLRLNYGPADYDVRHSFNGNYVFTMPKKMGNRLLSGFAGGWSLAETFYFHTGYPFSAVNTGVRSNLRNVTGLASSVILADFVGGSQNCGRPSPSAAGFVQCLDPNSFATAGTQTDFGNVKRNSFRGPGYFDTDVNISKNFHMGERYVLGFGANLFNILNHPNFDLPVNNLANGNFGQIQSTVGSATSPYGTQLGSVNPAVTGRVIQMNAHFVF